MVSRILQTYITFICLWILLCQDSILSINNDPTQIAEKEALLSFKSGITHDPKGILRSWNSSVSSFPCSNGWNGVICTVINDTPRVTFLNLHSSNLTGTISGNSISNLTQLTYLNLSTNAFFGAIPPQLGAFRYLTYLDFKENSLSGSIPPQLGNCSSLKWLDLSKNKDIRSSIPSSLGQLSELYMLQLHDLPNLTGSIPPQLGNLSNLIYLYFGGSSLTGSIPAEIGNLVKLKELYLYSNPLNGTIPPQLGQLQNLQYLSLFINSISGVIPAELGNLTSLEYMWCMMTKLQGPIPSELGNLTNLKQLDLSLNQHQGTIPPELGRLENLELINCFGNSLNGSIPKEIGNLKNLQKIYLQSNSLSGQIPSEFGGLERLQELELYYNKLSGPLPVELSKLSNLTTLILFDNQLTGPIPEELGNITTLALLYLGNNQFSGHLPATLGNLRSVQYLEVSPNNLMGSIPSTLGQLTQLVYLDLSRNNFSGTIPTEIGNCTKLQWIKLGNNSNLEGMLPETFQRLRDLHSLSVSNNRLNGSLPASFANYSSLVVLDFSRNQFTGSVPDSWGQLENLRVLIIGSNKLEGNLPPWLWNLNQLQLLDLSNNKFIGSISSKIGQMEGFKINATKESGDKTLWNDDASFEIKGTVVYFKYLLAVVISFDLSGNQLNGSIPTEIGLMTGLYNLNLSNNYITGSIPSVLGSVTTLESLDLSYNQLTGEIPIELTNLTSLAFLNLSNNQLSGPIPTGSQFGTFSNRSYLGNKDLCGSPLSVICQTNDTSMETNYESAKHRNIIIVASVFGALIFILFALSAAYPIRKKAHCFIFQKVTVEIFDKSVKISQKELSRATASYSNANIIGSGGFSVVYRGKLSNGMVVAIKRLKLHSEPDIEKYFSAEVTALGNVRHRNLVKILGTLTTRQMKCLVLEYVPNGNLEMHLHNDNRCDINWNQRLNIALGIAHALEYLHNDTGLGQILHCDLKPSNILLDEDLEPHISDFGIARLVNVGDDISVSANFLKGSIGYVAPEYAYGERLTDKVDVFSYGVVLLELITRRRPTSETFGEGKTLGGFIQAALREGTWQQVIDPALLNDENVVDDDEQRRHTTQDMYELLTLGVSCVCESPRDRPSMKDVVITLLHLRNAKQESISLTHMTTIGNEQIPSTRSREVLSERESRSLTNVSFTSTSSIDSLLNVTDSDSRESHREARHS